MRAHYLGVFRSEQVHPTERSERSLPDPGELIVHPKLEHRLIRYRRQFRGWISQNFTSNGRPVFAKRIGYCLNVAAGPKLLRTHIEIPTILEKVLLTIAAGISGEDLGYLLHKNAFTLPLIVRLTVRQSPRILFAALGRSLGSVSSAGRRSRCARQRHAGVDVKAELSGQQYVNDRPYVRQSSFGSVAMFRVYGTAMNNERGAERQNLADEQLDIEAVITAIPCQRRRASAA